MFFGEGVWRVFGRKRASCGKVVRKDLGVLGYWDCVYVSRCGFGEYQGDCFRFRFVERLERRLVLG